jgi:hypothetical protein
MVAQSCPWCGSIISSQKFEEITARIRKEEQHRLAETEKRLRTQLSSELRVVEKQAADQVAAANAQRDAALQQVKDAATREKAIREETRGEALEQAQTAGELQLEQQREAFEARLTELQKALVDVQNREGSLRAEARDQALQENQVTIEAEREKQQRLVEEKNALQEERDVVLRRLAETEALSSSTQENFQNQMAEVMDASEKQHQKEIADLRSVLEADRDQAVLNKQVEFTRERERWQKEFLDLQHKLQKKTADEIGDGAEVNLFEALKGAFEDDTITRVKKGQPGPDLRHEIRHNGEVCGLIVYDSKHRQGWHLSYATKLRQDQLDAQADHAILTTAAFPTGKKELCIESDIIVVNPARAVPIVHLLRRALISMHVRGLSLKARAEKTERLYAFMNSAVYHQRFEQFGAITKNLLEVDVEEKEAHDKTWKKRGKLLQRQGAVLRELDTEISAIIEGNEESRKPAA